MKKEKTLCIICKKELIPSEEHIIPDALLFNSDKDIVIYDVCVTCNRKFGHTVDQEFLNQDFIKLLRLIHKDFMKEKYNPKIIIRDFKTIIINNEERKLDLVIDKLGSHPHFQEKPIKHENGSLSFLIKGSKINKKIEEIKKSNKNIKDIKISSYKIKPVVEVNLHKLLYQQLTDFRMGVPFTRLFIKMGLEYICKKFGREVVLKEKFDPLRALIKFETNNYESFINFSKHIILPYEPSEMNSIQHEIGIKYSAQIDHWYFYFFLYKIIKYEVSLPNDEIYYECCDVINNRRVNK